MKIDHRSILTVAAKEFSSFFTSPIAYVCILTFLVAVNWLFFRTFFLIGQADIRALFGILPWVFLFFVPAIAMGRWAEERKQGTVEIMFTLPVDDVNIILGKYLAGLGLIAVPVLLTFPIPLTVAVVGNLDTGPVIGGYLGTLFLGSAYLSIGLCASALSENQIVAFILGVAASFVLLIIGTPIFLGGYGGLISNAIQYAGLSYHFESISRGVIDSRDIIYYLSVTGFFLFLNLVILRTRARR